MKRVIRAATADDLALKEAQDIYKKSKELLDTLEKTSGYVLEKCDLYDLIERLREDVPAINIAVQSMGNKKPKYDDMW